MISNRFLYTEQLQRDLEGSDATIKLAAAMQLLAIHEANFRRIQTQELKIETLDYKFCRAELELLALYNALNPVSRQTLSLIKTAYEIILTSPIITEHTSEFSPFSRGLNELRMRTTYDSDMQDQNVDLNKSVLPVDRIESGVEPKFKAILAKDPLRFLLTHYPNAEERWEIMLAHDANIEKLYELFKEQLPQYVIKLTYQEITSNHKIIPNGSDLERASTMKQIKDKFPMGYQLALLAFQIAKTKHINLLNTLAAIEGLGNDVASTSGLEVQDQRLFPAKLQQSIAQLLLIGKWLTGAQDLGGKNGCYLKGGTKDNHYLVKPVIIPFAGIAHVSDNSILDLAEFLAVFFYIGDPDGIGSKAQNKMRLHNKLIGIDFGKAFQLNIAKNISTDFQIIDNETRALFKNYSIFDDAPRSAKLAGIIRLARLMGDIVLTPDVLASYGENFKDKITAITPHADEMVFNDYINYFKDLKLEYIGDDEASVINRNSCDRIIKDVKKIQEQALLARKLLVDKFRHYLQLESAAVDLLENFEKLMAAFDKNTSLRSPDKTVLLNHIKVLKNPVKDWGIAILNGKYVFTAKFADLESPKRASRAIQQWLKLSQADESAMVRLTASGELQIEFEQSKAALAKMSALFAEDQLMQTFHGDDYKLQQHYQLVARVQACLASLQLNGIDGSLIEAPNLPSQYQLRLEKSASPLVNLHLQTVLTRGELSFARQGTAWVLNVSKNEMANIEKALSTFLPAIEEEKRITQELDKINLIVNRINKLAGLKSVIQCKRVGSTFQISTYDAYLDALLQAQSPMQGFKKMGNHILVESAQLPSFYSYMLSIEEQYKLDRQKNLAQGVERKGLQTRKMLSLVNRTRNLTDFNLLFEGKYHLVPVAWLKLVDTNKEYQLAIASDCNGHFLNFLRQRLNFTSDNNSFSFSHDDYEDIADKLRAAINDYQEFLMTEEEKKIAAIQAKQTHKLQTVQLQMDNFQRSSQLAKQLQGVGEAVTFNCQYDAEKDAVMISFIGDEQSATFIQYMHNSLREFHCPANQTYQFSMVNLIDLNLLSHFNLNVLTACDHYANEMGKLHTIYHYRSTLTALVKTLANQHWLRPQKSLLAKSAKSVVGLFGYTMSNPDAEAVNIKQCVELLLLADDKFASEKLMVLLGLIVKRKQHISAIDGEFYKEELACLRTLQQVISELYELTRTLPPIFLQELQHNEKSSSIFAM